MNQVFLSLGSNVGNRKANLAGALKKLSAENRIVQCSGIYETEPWGNENQPRFLNQVILMNTSFNPEELLVHLKSIEKHMGRKPSKEIYSPRTIDIDILFYNDLIITLEDLKIPHPWIHERRFVLIPLAEIAPDYRHPVLGKSVKRLLEVCDDTLKVMKTE